MNAIDKFIQIIIFILIFFMLFAPAELMILKMGIVSILIIISSIDIIKNKKKIIVSKCVLAWFIIYISLGIIYIALSVFNNNKGATNFIGISIINPIIYFIFCIGLSNSKYFDSVKKHILTLGVCIGIYNVIFTICINIVPEMGYGTFPFIRANEGGLNLGFTKFTSENITILTFLTPFAIALFLLHKEKRVKKKTFLIIIFGILSATLSARTAYIIALGITPITIVILMFCTNKKINLNIKKIFKTVIFIIILLILIVGVFEIDLGLIMQKMQQSFNINNESVLNDNGGYIRAMQFKDLIESWKLKPIFGWGDGANAINIVRGTDGMYELMYIAILMQRGIVGLLLYIGQIVWIYIKGIKLIKNDMNLGNLMFATLVGLFAILLANATNPYLYSFDRLMILFYPLAIINRSYVVLVENKI